MSEPKRIFLGSVTIEPGETAAFDISVHLTPNEIAERLRLVEEKRAADALIETQRLREMFLTPAPEGEKNDDEEGP
jgi:hypothetical protein